MPGDPGSVVDDIDRRLLAELTADGRASVNELAAKVGVGRATAYARLARLRAEGVIQGFTVRIDPRKVGLGVSVLLLVRADQRAWRELVPELRALDGVEWLGATAGDFDFALLVRAPDVQHVRDVVLDELLAVDGVRSCETILVLDDHWSQSRPG